MCRQAEARDRRVRQRERGEARSNPCSDEAAYAAREADVSDPLGRVHDIGALVRACDACGAWKFPGEGMSCCGARNGRPPGIVAPPLTHIPPPAPAELRQIMDPNYSGFDRELHRVTVWKKPGPSADAAQNSGGQAPEISPRRSSVRRTRGMRLI